MAQIKPSNSRPHRGHHDSLVLALGQQLPILTPTPTRCTASFTSFALGINSGPIAGYPDTICLPDALTGESPWASILPHMTGAQNASLKSDVKDVSGIFDHYRMSARAIQN
jgi:hypothetical protein